MQTGSTARARLGTALPPLPRVRRLALLSEAGPCSKVRLPWPALGLSTGASCPAASGRSIVARALATRRPASFCAATPPHVEPCCCCERATRRRLGPRFSRVLGWVRAGCAVCLLERTAAPAPLCTARRKTHKTIMTDATLDADVAAATTFPDELVNEQPVFGADWRAEAEKQGDLVHSLGAQSHVRSQPRLRKSCSWKLDCFPPGCASRETHRCSSCR